MSGKKEKCMNLCLGDNLRLLIQLWSANIAENTAQHLLNSPLVLLDPKEDVQLQSPMMEPDFRVNAGNYYVVCKVTPGVITKISSFKPDYLYAIL